MSLDLLKCKIVPQEEANEAVIVGGKSWDLPRNYALQRLQESGIVLYKSERVGRNCMNDEWHRQYELLSPSVHDDDLEEVIHQTKLDEFRTIFPGEVKTKLLPFIEIDQIGDWINNDTVDNVDWDFLYICW